MSDAAPVRGGIYPYHGNLRRTDFVVISIDSLNTGGTVIVCEVTGQPPPEDVRGLIAVHLTADDPLPGRWVLCWRVNYATAGRFDVAAGPGIVTPATMIRVIGAVRSAIEPL
jgi:hypothetical protein